jgi:hypothetical protein
VGSKVSGGANAFVADTDHDKARASARGGPWVELQWLSRQRLLIRYDKAARIFRRVNRVGNISVTYEAIAR